MERPGDLEDDGTPDEKTLGVGLELLSSDRAGQDTDERREDKATPAS